MKPQELIRVCDYNKPGIYMILCMPSNKAVIGSSKNIRRRWIEHRYKLRNGKHGNPHLQNSYNKYGKDSLLYAVIENCSEDVLRDREAFFITSLDEEYRMNLAAVTDIVKISDETRRKMSEAKKGIIPWNKGKRNVYSKETIEAMSLAKKDYIPWTKGRTMKDETKKKLSIIAKSKKIIRDAKGRILTIEKEV